MLFKLFTVFMKVGAVTFGGGYAMLPILEREVVVKNKFTCSEELVDYFAIGQCTPGIIAVNVATFIGYKQAGVLGSIFATLGLVFPSLVIITLIASSLNSFLDNDLIIHALNGIKIGVFVTILMSLYKLISKIKAKKTSMVIYISFLIIGIFIFSNPIIFVAIGAIIALLSKGGSE